MRIFLITIFIFVALLINFIFWDYHRTGNIIWVENIIQSLSFLAVFFLVRWIFKSNKK